MYAKLSYCVFSLEFVFRSLLLFRVTCFGFGKNKTKGLCDDEEDDEEEDAKNCTKQTNTERIMARNDTCLVRTNDEKKYHQQQQHMYKSNDKGSTMCHIGHIENVPQICVQILSSAHNRTRKLDSQQIQPKINRPTIFSFHFQCRFSLFWLQRDG